MEGFVFFVGGGTYRYTRTVTKAVSALVVNGSVVTPFSQDRALLEPWPPLRGLLFFGVPTLRPP